MAANPPPWVPPYCQKYLTAYHRLQMDRQINIAGHLGSIPMQSKVAYLALVPGVDPETFVEIITAADDAFLNAVARVRSYRED